MNRAAFTINLGDLEHGPKHLQSPLTADWVRHVLKDTEVGPGTEDGGVVDVTLTKNGTDVLVQGRLELTVSVPCARTLDPAIYHIHPDVFLMLTPGSGVSGAPSRASGGKRETATATRPKRTSRRRPNRGGWENDPELSDEDAAQDTYFGDQIVLDDFLREFILLEIPMLPLREDLRGVPFEASSPLPQGAATADARSAETAEEPLDPRLSPLRDLKARLENKE